MNVAERFVLPREPKLRPKRVLSEAEKSVKRANLAKARAVLAEAKRKRDASSTTTRPPPVPMDTIPEGIIELGGDEPQNYGLQYIPMGQEPFIDNGDDRIIPLDGMPPPGSIAEQIQQNIPPSSDDQGAGRGLSMDPISDVDMSDIEQQETFDQDPRILRDTLRIPPNTSRLSTPKQNRPPVVSSLPTRIHQPPPRPTYHIPDDSPSKSTEHVTPIASPWFPWVDFSIPPIMKRLGYSFLCAGALYAIYYLLLRPQVLITAQPAEPSPNVETTREILPRPKKQSVVLQSYSGWKPGLMQ